VSPLVSTHDGAPISRGRLISERVERGAAPGLSARGGGPMGVIRRSLLRLLWPYIAEQHELWSQTAIALSELDDAVGDLRERISAIVPDVELALAQLHARPFVSDTSFVTVPDGDGQRRLGFDVAEDVAAVDVYRGFEDVFRGHEEFIRGRQQFYVDVLREHSPVLDLACGRGELLDLLSAAGIEARGVDLDSGMVEHVRAKGHEVVHGDAVEYLEAQEPNSLGAVFCAQLIEHLSYEQFTRLLALAREKLVDGGVLVAETVNPHSIGALKTFWVDLTHRTPIFPEVALVYARLLGFAEGRIVFPNGRGDFDDDIQVQGEYALIAHTRSPRRVAGAGARRGVSLVERFPPPDLPWTDEYRHLHTAFVREMLADGQIGERFQRRQPLPGGYGIGLDERVVEYPWLLAQPLRGRVLDAGAALNHAHVLDSVLPRVESLHIITLAPEPVAFPERGVSYVYGDIRALPYRDGEFVTVVCISTLEHVGMDNRRFGTTEVRAAEPLVERGRAVAELRRVTASGGSLLITVPYGRPDDFDWGAQFDRAALATLQEQLDASDFRVDVYRYSGNGWQLSDLAAAADATYEDHSLGGHATPDRVAAARAVACISATY
jgi:SAM-dependent methyltransferase